MGNLTFEDGFNIDYSSLDAKVKLLEIAFKLAPLVKDLDFKNNPLETQLKCVRAIRSCLDFTTFNKGFEKIVDTERNKTGSLAKMALFGQGSCHGCSSVMAAFLLPFAQALGIDIKYRGGFHFNRGETVSNEIERHQWLELTLRPSMKTIVCDLWHAGVNDDDSWLTMPSEVAYEGI